MNTFHENELVRRVVAEMRHDDPLGLADALYFSLVDDSFFTEAEREHLLGFMDRTIEVCEDLLLAGMCACKPAYSTR